MPFKDRVAETSSTSGTGPFTLTGALIAHRSFNSAYATGDVLPYFAEDGVNWEVLIGTFTGPATLSRDTTLASSNAGAAVSFPDGVKHVVATFPANMIDPDNALTANSDLRVASQKAIKAYIAGKLAVGATSAGVNAQTGTTYIVVTGDAAKEVTLSNASAVALTIAAAGSTGFAAGWSTILKNKGNGVVTLTPTTSTVEGAATLVLRRGDWAVITSDGANYDADITRAASRGVFALTDSLSSMTFDAGAYDDFRLLTTTGVGTTRLIPNPTNLVDGQKINIRVKLGAASHVWTYGTKWKLLGTAITRSTASGSIIFISGQYDATDDTLVYAEANSA